MLEWEKIDPEMLPLEKTRDVLAALIRHLQLDLYRKEWYEGGIEYEFRSQKTQRDYSPGSKAEW